LFLAAKI